MLDALYAVWDLDCDDPGIIGFKKTNDARVSLKQ